MYSGLLNIVLEKFIIQETKCFVSTSQSKSEECLLYEYGRNADIKAAEVEAAPGFTVGYRLKPENSLSITFGDQKYPINITKNIEPK